MAERVKPYQSQVNYWLFATDPDEYSFWHLQRDTSTVWDGVTDYPSLKNLRDVETDEEVLIFHAGREMAVVGIARVTSDPYPSPRGTSSDEMAADVVPVRPLERPVPLAEFENLPEFQDWEFISNPELAVVPVSPEVWDRLLEISVEVLAYSTEEDQE